jgi:hypothetical protein
VIEPIHVLSLGAGVQSSTLALMAAAGEVTPMPKCAIFADTQAEPKSVYVWLDFLEKQLPYPVYRVTRGSLEKDALLERQRKDGKGSWIPSGIPHYSINSDGSHGHGPRQCTHHFKLTPLLKRQRGLIWKPHLTMWRRRHKYSLKLIGVHEKLLAQWKRDRKSGIKCEAPVRPNEAWDYCQRNPLVISWIGISTDEASRMKPSRTPYFKNHYPLIDLGISRSQCLQWMKQRGFPQPPRSACVFCPYHSDNEWIRLRDQEPEEFERACQFDEAYRAGKIRTVSQKGFEPFLHASRKPLREVVFKPVNTKIHPDQFTNDCEGMCGV